MKNVKTWDMEFAQNASRNAASYDDKIIVMEHTNVDDSTTILLKHDAINPFGRSKFQGQLKMTPSMNPWFDDNVKPTEAVNEVGENDMFESELWTISTVHSTSRKDILVGSTFT